MIHRLIIPGIVAGALHGGLLLITGTPALPVPKTTEVVIRDHFPVLPPIPPDPVVDDDRPRGSGNADAPSVPLLPPTPMEHFKIDGISETFTIDPPRPNVDPNALRVDPGDYTGQGLKNGDGVARLFTEIDLDEKPRAVFQAAPDYPAAAKHDGLSGTVVVMFSVDENGLVHDARVTGSPDRVFDEAAVRAVSRWRFEPGRVQGRRVAFKMSVPIAFALSGGD